MTFKVGWFVLSVLSSTVITCCSIKESKAECFHKNNKVPKLIYSQLKCIPKYKDVNNNCTQEYVCEHNARPENTCYFKGKILNVGETIYKEDLKDVHYLTCSCNKRLGFNCVTMFDGCAEHWNHEYPRPECYLRRQLNHECAVGEICPPFDSNAICKVNNKIYMEGELFQHPNDHCSQCVCEKGFDNRYEPPFCQVVNCTDTILNCAEQIDQFCAPFYKDLEQDCCPERWICPSVEDKFYCTRNSHLSSGTKCQFGKNFVTRGDSVVQNQTILCKCIIPPYLHCSELTQED